LRYLQTLAEIATERNSTTVFPIPLDLFEPFMQLRQMTAAKSQPPAPTAPAANVATPAVITADEPDKT
jgi:hypothetical protein